MNAKIIEAIELSISHVITMDSSVENNPYHYEHMGYIKGLREALRIMKAYDDTGAIDRIVRK